MGKTSKPQRRLRALIVEDEAILAFELEIILTELEADVVGVAMSAAQAEKIVQDTQPDFITMDIDILGACNGIVAAQDIFEKYGVRSIFVTANCGAAMRRQAGPCKALGWVEKPLDKLKLANVVRQLELCQI